MAIPEITQKTGRGSDTTRTQPPPPPAFSHGPVTVAVFDTGLDSTGIGAYVTSPSGSAACPGAAANGGWNFVNNTPDWNDDNPERHGTEVSRFILNQVLKYHQNQLRILPVKIADATGKGSLFSLLCGLAYAGQQGAQLVNASFGFYSPRNVSSPTEVDTNVYLLQAFVQHYLTAKNILLIAAAGNEDPVNEPPVYNSANPASLRNLDSVSFYPASLSRTLDNVIAVTTVFPNPPNTGHVSSNQNFSPRVVEAGVNGVLLNGGICYFKHPWLPGATLTGTSFATPIATGNIGANYFLRTGPGGHPGARQQILDQLRTAGIGKSNPAPLATQKVRDGYYMSK